MRKNNIGPELVKKLREQTGISVMQCKYALEAANGDMGKAILALKAGGALISEKKKDRNLGSGTISSYIHSDGNSGTIVELLCETDFVGKNEDFRKLAYYIAMHITAMNSENEKNLLKEKYIKDDNTKIEDLIADAIQKFGERIEVGKFSRISIS